MRSRSGAVLAAVAVVAGCSGPAYVAPVGPHFDGERSHNDPPARQATLGELRLALAEGGARHAPFVVPGFGEARDVRCPRAP